MKLDIYNTIEALAAKSGEQYWDTAAEYGEPGYGDATLVVLGSYWCRCGRTDVGRGGSMHDMQEHYPLIWAKLEEEGVQFEWHDEWIVDHETGKAYRTSPDSYGWKPSIMFTERGDLVTPDDDIETIVDHADTTGAVLNTNFVTKESLVDAGFVPFSTDNETGWHPGQHDDPRQVADRARIQFPDCQVVNIVTGSGQFETYWDTYVRTEPVEPQYLGDIMDFDSVIEVDDAGRVQFRPEAYAPDVYETDSGIAVDGAPAWTLMDGYSRQDRYAGPVMHESEFIGGRIAEDILDTPGIYVAVVVYDYTEDALDNNDGNGPIVGWAIATRETVEV